MDVKVKLFNLYYVYGPFLLKLPYYHTNSTFFYMIMDRCIYLNQGHFVTKLNNGFLIRGRTFYPQKSITVTMKNVIADLKCTTNWNLFKVPLPNSHKLLNYVCTLGK